MYKTQHYDKIIIIKKNILHTYSKIFNKFELYDHCSNDDVQSHAVDGVHSLQKVLHDVLRLHRRNHDVLRFHRRSHDVLRHRHRRNVLHAFPHDVLLGCIPYVDREPFSRRGKLQKIILLLPTLVMCFPFVLHTNVFFNMNRNMMFYRYFDWIRNVLVDYKMKTILKPERLR